MLGMQDAMRERCVMETRIVSYLLCVRLGYLGWARRCRDGFALDILFFSVFLSLAFPLGVSADLSYLL